MIISHSRRFIMVKSRKTASTSIERAIIPQLDRRDCWTPITIPPMAGNNYYSLWPVDVMTAKFEWFRDIVGRDGPFHHRFYVDHVPLSRIRRNLPAVQFTAYRKYAFDRNPWDYMVSLYFYMKRKPPVADWDFDRFIADYPVVQNRSLYSENGEVIADRVFRFEELPAALAEISAETGLSFASLPDDKRGYRAGTDYRSHYSAASRDLVAERFAATIALLGYEF